jgi:HK97 family phage portal protein
LKALNDFSNFISKVNSGSINKTTIINGYFPTLTGSNTLSDVHISNGNAETIGAFFTCLRIKAETMASIHTYVQEVEGKKQFRDKSHPVDYLVSMKPNQNTNAWSFWYTMQLIEDLWGNAYAEITRSRGEVTSITILPAWEMEVRQVKDGGAVWYYHKGRAIPARNIIHFKQNSMDGIVGRSIVSIQREQLGLAKKQENYAAKMVGSKPPAVFEGGENLNAESAQKAGQSFSEQVKKGIIPIAFGGLKYKNIMMSAGDLQLFEMKGVTTADIYGMFRMPQSKGGNYSRDAGATYNNVEQSNINFVQDVVIPCTTQKENECNIKLFRKDEYGKHEIYFDLSDLLKADLKTQAEFYDKAWGKGWYSANEIRKKFGDNPIDEQHGKRYYIQAAYVPVEKIDAFYEGKTTAPKNTRLNGHEITEN